MALEKRFRDMLESDIGKIREFYQDKLNKVYSSILEKIEKKSDFKDLYARKDEVNEEIEKLRTEIRKLENKKTDIKGEIRKKKKFTDNSLVDSDIRAVKRNSNIRLSERNAYSVQEIEALKEISKSIEYTNFINLMWIAKNVNNTFNLCATNKEARNLLISFQNKNWRAIWIDLPALALQDDFKVDENGNINCKMLPEAKK